MTATNGHAAALLHATGAGLTERREALVRAHDDLIRLHRALEDARAEIARLERSRDRAVAKLAKHDAARAPEALALRVLQVDRNVWHVPSDTAAGGYRTVLYGVHSERYTCDCEGYVHRGGCRHEAAVGIANKPAAMVATDRADSRQA